VCLGHQAEHVVTQSRTYFRRSLFTMSMAIGQQSQPGCASQGRLGPIISRDVLVLVLSPAVRVGARNHNRTIERDAAQAIDYDYAHEHEHEHDQSEIHLTMCYFTDLRLEQPCPSDKSAVILSRIAGPDAPDGRCGALTGESQAERRRRDRGAYPWRCGR
jgi:hypothetical protein